jgi:hypothetical protein
MWGGHSASQPQLQQQHRRNRSSGALKGSISWADLAGGQPIGSAASDARYSSNHSPAPASQQQQQQQQQPAVWDQAAPVTAAQLGLLVGRAKAVLPAARLEPQWLRPKGFVEFDADAWAGLLEDAELLLVRYALLLLLLGVHECMCGHGPTLQLELCLLLLLNMRETSAVWHIATCLPTNAAF